MVKESKSEQEIPHLLAGGLELRWATLEDAAELAEFNVRIHTNDPSDPELWIGHWTKALMDGRHPTTSADDFTVVVDPNQAGKIVSSLCLISQTWTYNGLPFPVGRVELVGTDPEYRRRGLIREQMAVIHARSQAKGEILQAITGIPWYYRMYGYEMAVNLGGGREFFWQRPENNVQVDEEIYTIRPATIADIPILETLYTRNCAASLMASQRSPTIWQYLLEGAHRESIDARNALIIETMDSQVVAYFDYRVWGTTLGIRELGVRAGHSWRSVCLFITRHLQKVAGDMNEEREKKITKISFSLGEVHPAYEALGRQLEKLRNPYAWYLRVPDLPGFISFIAPVLEKRLAESVLAGYSGNLRLNFYQSSLKIEIQRGNLGKMEPYEPKNVEDADATFPGLTFLQLLFGYRSSDDLYLAFPDCYAENAEAAVLLNCLFPRQSSDINPL